MRWVLLQVKFDYFIIDFKYIINKIGYKDKTLRKILFNKKWYIELPYRTFPIRQQIKIIFQINHCAIRCGIKSVPEHHHRCGRSAASPAEHGTHGVRPSFRTEHGLCFFHVFKSANNSSRLVYPFTEGSFAILSASSMAVIVSLFG